MCILQHSLDDFDHGLSWRQWPGSFRFLDGCLKGRFRLPEAERSGFLGCPRPRLGVEGATKENGSLLGHRTSSVICPIEVSASRPPLPPAGTCKEARSLARRPHPSAHLVRLRSSNRAFLSTLATRVPLPPLRVVGRETRALGTSQKPCFPLIPERTSQRCSLLSPVTWQVHQRDYVTSAATERRWGCMGRRAQLMWWF